MWGLPGPGLKPVSAALAGRFLTSTPPGKPPSSVLCDDLEGWDGEGEREAHEGGNIGVHTADSLCCTTETNTTL